MTQGRRRLLAWQQRAHVTQVALAESLHISGPYCNQILTGVRRPGPAVMLRIEEVTGVPMRAWLETVKEAA